MIESNFAQLREYLLQPPSAALWEHLKMLLADWPHAEQDLAIGYANQHLSHWPDALRKSSQFADIASTIPVETSPHWPLVRHLQLTEGHPSRRAIPFLQRTPIAHITMLDLGTCLMQPNLVQMQAFFALPDLQHIQTLLLGPNAIRLDQNAEKFCRSSCAQGLHQLNIDGNRCTVKAIQVFAEHGIFDTLESFSANQTLTMDEHTCRFFCTIHAPHLRCLSLSRTQLSDKEFALLLDAPWIRHIEELDLSRNHLGAETLLAICESDRMVGLKRLDMRSNTSMSYTEYKLIDDVILDRLLHSPVAAQLQELHLNATQISAHGQERLDAFNRRTIA